MRKTLSLILALLLVVLSTGTVLAKSDNGNGQGNKNKQSLVTKGDHGKKVTTQVKKSVQEKYNAYHNEKSQAKGGFSDSNQHWASLCITEMTAVGLFSGYPDGTFKPDQELTQAEALSLIMRLAALDDVDENDDDTDLDEDDSDLNDVPSWARHDAAKAAKKGVIKLNRFHSAVQASRAQTAVMIAKALGLEPVDVSDTPFKDGILLSAEDIGYILALFNEGIMTGDHNGNFNPNKAITRAEMASILQRLLDEDKDEDEDEDASEIESISLPETATVEQGKSITLVATVEYADDSDDDADISWSSSDTSLATVDDGVVTAADDEEGTVTITATVEQDDTTLSAKCKVTVVEDIDATEGELKETDSIGSHDGKVYQEYDLEVDDEKISLSDDNVKSISLQKGNDTPILLTPNSDSSLWFNVQRESGDYTLIVVDEDDDVYEATLEWDAPSKVTASATGETREENGITYAEYELGDLSLSSFTCFYQIKPDGQVIELGATDDSNLWFKTDNQIDGKHIFLIKKSGDWYSSSIPI